MINCKFIKFHYHIYCCLRSESVVGESVVVIKKLLQLGAKEHTDIIIHMAKIIDKITVSMARASILWLIGEYSDHIPKIAPDVLRKMAKTFVNEVIVYHYCPVQLTSRFCIYTSGFLLFTFSKRFNFLENFYFLKKIYDRFYDSYFI